MVSKQFARQLLINATCTTAALSEPIPQNPDVESSTAKDTATVENTLNTRLELA